MKASNKQRKRKTEREEDCGSPSKVSNVSKPAVKSKYFEEQNKVAQKKLRKSASCSTKSGKEHENENVLSATSSVKSEDRLGFNFYNISCEDLAKSLLGKIIVINYEGKRLAGKIVETEAYLGPIDKGAHSYKGKTERNTAMFMKPGTAYVYNIYGMYCCMNISANGDGAAVLLRALQPIENLELMDKLRTKGKKAGSLLKKDGVGLCNGPSKLCQALGIKKDLVNKVDMCTSDLIWLEKGETVNDDEIVKCKRININYAEEWVDKPLRFYIMGNVFNSVKDKEAEKAISG